MSLAIKLVGLACGVPTDHDGRFLLEYDPTCQWKEGGQLCVHLLSTDDLGAAKRYPDLVSLHADYSRSVGTRADGKPDRPITAYTMEIVKIPDEGESK